MHAADTKERRMYSTIYLRTLQNTVALSVTEEPSISRNCSHSASTYSVVEVLLCRGFDVLGGAVLNLEFR